MKHNYLNAVLWLALAVTSATFAAEETAASGKKAVVKRIEVEEFDKLRARKESVVLDVRTESEFKAGHIPGAVNVDVNAGDFDAKIAKLDKNKTYLVHCMVGHRSAKACDKLAAAGVTNLFDFGVGLKAWEKAGKPVEK